MAAAVLLAALVLTGRVLYGASPACRRGQLLVFTRMENVAPFGCVGGYATLGIVAVPARGGPDRRGLRCPAERRIGTPAVHRVRAVLAACPEGPPSVLGGSVLVRWSERGTVVQVSTPGAGVANQRLVATLADHVRLVTPRR